MNSKRILAALLSMCLVLCLWACGGNNTANTESTGDTTENIGQNTDSQNDGKVTYTITVVDSEGNPMPGVMVQLCTDLCVPVLTDANGVASKVMPEADYKVSVTTMPEGYTVENNEFYFESGSTEMTITLTAA